MSENESVSDVENDLEVILENDQDNEQPSENANVEANDGSQQNDEDETKKVKPKRVVKNPQPKLNEQTLKGPRGLAAIEGYFERVKFKGRGYEEQDLNVLMKTYEYWCHRLFPKFPFDNCIARLEKLGTKRATQVQLKKIRMGLNFDEPTDTAILSEEEHGTEGFVDTYNDQFEAVVSTADTEPEITEDQLERIRQNMERAKRLREEKLRKLAENTQNSVDSLSNQNGENTQFDIFNTQNVTEAQIESEIDRNETEDNEDDIENILSYINTNQNPKDGADCKSNLEDIEGGSPNPMETENDCNASENVNKEKTTSVTNFAEVSQGKDAVKNMQTDQSDV